MYDQRCIWLDDTVIVFNQALLKYGVNHWRLAGSTPLVRLRRLAGDTNTILLKLEGNNPAGSVKDRPAVSMINRAEARGDRKKRYPDPAVAILVSLWRWRQPSKAIRWYWLCLSIWAQSASWQWLPTVLSWLGVSAIRYGARDLALMQSEGKGGIGPV